MSISVLHLIKNKQNFRHIFLIKKCIGFYFFRQPTTYPFASQYTQLIWAETYKIGCARVAFQRSDGANLTYREHFICNYGPSGNIPGQPVYKIGEPCSECPTGTGCSIEYPGLCTSEMVYEMTYRNLTKMPVFQHLENSSNMISKGFILQLLYLHCIIFIFY